MSFELNINYSVYEFGPIDIWNPMSEFKEYYLNCNYGDKKRLRTMLKTFLNILSDSGACWEGDIRGNELYLGNILNPEIVGGVVEFIGLKQDNNGSSFLIFPCDMPIYNAWKCSNHNSYSKDLTKEIVSIVDEFAPDGDLEEYISESVHMIHANLSDIKWHLSRIKDASLDRI